MDGMAEEYYFLGVNIIKYGGMYLDDRTPVFSRPPGYPVFLAGVLTAWDTVENILAPEKIRTIDDSIAVIYLSQGILLALSTAILFLWISEHFSLRNSFLTAILFGCNPYLIILIGLLHYSILHIFSLIVSCYALSSAVSTRPVLHPRLIGAGVLWGLTTLIRPVTLILPFFAVFLFLNRSRPACSTALRYTVIFTLGMLIVILPYTLRNYHLTRRIIPVNAQAGIAFWGGTVRELPRDPNHYRWWGIWYPDGQQIYSKVTGKPRYDVVTYIRDNLALEDALKEDAIRRFLRRPQIYFYNVFQNALTITVDINSIFIKIFQALQTPGRTFDNRWLKIYNPQNFAPDGMQNLFKVFFHLISLTGLFGIAWAMKDRDPFLLAPGLVFLCFLTAHSITFMDLMYYYFKLPFNFLFFGYGIHALDRYNIQLFPRQGKLPLGLAVQGSLAIIVTALTANVIFGLWSGV